MRHLCSSCLPLFLLYTVKAVFMPSEEASDALREAISRLHEAKRLHDRMELVYRPHMDFRSLSEYTEQLIRKLFL